MKTPFFHVASYIAAIIASDMQYENAEKQEIEEIAEILDFDHEEFRTEVESEMEKLTSFSAEESRIYLKDKANFVCSEEKEMIFVAVIRASVIDGVLNAPEVDKIMEIASALSIQQNRAILLLADTIRFEQDIEISFE